MAAILHPTLSMIHALTILGFSLIFTVAFAAALMPDFETRKFTYSATLSFRLLFLAIAAAAVGGLWR